MNLLNKKGYVSFEVFNSLGDKYLSLTSDLIRYNTLLSVGRAGTGHLGASLSIIELLTEIYFRSFDFSPKKLKSKDRDIFILSKGHAAPSLYAILAAKGYFSITELDKLRRLEGLAGHCDIETNGIEANTGSLAMGLSKAVGYAIAKKRFNHQGNVIVIVGDGELQEGQCWEAVLSAVSYKLDNLFILIDDNKVQTDQLSINIVQYGDLVFSLRKIGFFVQRSNGRVITDIHNSFTKLKAIYGKPKILWSDTIKGQGISFMEHSNVLKEGDERYIWHNKAPNKGELRLALDEIIERNKRILSKLGFEWDLELSVSNIPIAPIQVDIKGDNLITGLKEGLKELGERYKNIVVLDADLEEDCGFIPFHQRFTKRFFEMGVMEQHLVSVAATMARMGYIPVISSYAAFLTSRANEQIYNLATEGGKALIIGNMAGILPGTPGQSHTGFRDIACMKNIPNLSMYQPVTAKDTKQCLKRYFEGDFDNILYLRLSMAASREELKTPSPRLAKGFSQILKKGKHAAVIGIGPVVLGECMRAVEILTRQGIEIEVWNHPWLINFNKQQFSSLAKRRIPLLIVEDHHICGGFGESLMAFLSKNNIRFPRIKHIAVKNFPKTGFRQETLEAYGLDTDNIISAIRKLL